MILSRSRGLTTVREAAPAHPPATKYEATWGDKNPKLFFAGGGVLSMISSCCCCGFADVEAGADAEDVDALMIKMIVWCQEYRL